MAMHDAFEKPAFPADMHMQQLIPLCWLGKEKAHLYMLMDPVLWGGKLGDILCALTSLVRLIQSSLEMWIW
jgi:hypothetical protein